MDGVITAIVAFLLACLIWPHLVRNRSQYYAAFVCVILVLVIDVITLMFSGTAAGSKLAVFGGVVKGTLAVVALIMCFLFAGGMTAGQLAGELKGAYEVMRRGETEKEVIIPLSGQRAAGGGGAGSGADDIVIPRRGGPAAPPGDAPRASVIDPETGEDKPADRR
jgi:drug/metabolite transporter superfamily protein YnfA